MGLWGPYEEDGWVFDADCVLVSRDPRQATRAGRGTGLVDASCIDGALVNNLCEVRRRVKVMVAVELTATRVSTGLRQEAGCR